MIGGGLQQKIKNVLPQLLSVLIFAGLLFLVTAVPAHAFVEGWLSLLRVEMLKIAHAILTSFPAMLVFITGTLLNTSIYWFVVQMGDLINNSTGVGFAINSLWVVIRDVMNIAFIFGLIYIGIKTILNAEDSGTRKNLIQLIGAALLINFSLFITKLVIDFGNIAASQIFNLFGTTSAIDPGYAGVYGISGAFMQALGILGFLTDTNIFENLTITTGLVYSLLSMVFLLITAVVFAVGAFMITARFIALVFYMIFSPFMFLGWVIPYFSGESAKWWSGFLRYTFFAPAFLFCLYISYLVLERFRIAGSTNGDLATIMSSNFGTSGALLTVLTFVLSVGMLGASAIVANRMSIVGASSSLAFMNNIKNGLQGFAYRNTVGRGANMTLKGYDALDRSFAADEAKDSNRNWFGRRGAQMKRTAAKLALGGAMIPGEETRRGIQNIRNYGAGGAGLDSAEKSASERKIRVSQTTEQRDLKSTIKAFQDNPDGTTTDKDGNVISNQVAMERAVRDTSGSSLVSMVKDGDEALVKSVSGELTDSQWKALQDDKEIDGNKKGDLAASRSANIEARLIRLHKKGNPNATLQDVIHKADASELKALGSTKVLPVAGMLTAKQIKDWKDLTPTEKNDIKDARKEQLYTQAGLDPKNPIIADADTEGVNKIFNRFESDAERAELPKEILLSYAGVLKLNKNTLSKIADNDGISPDDRALIKEKILNAYDPATSPEWESFDKWFKENNVGQRY